MNVKLLTSIILLITQAAFAQGTFTYTFSGDDSPLSVWATFTASPQAVATGRLTQTNVTTAYLLQGGNTWTMYQLSCPVNSATGQPNAAPQGMTFVALYNRNEIDIDGGANHDPYTTIVYWPWIGSPSNYSSVGSWSMTHNVPEPNTASLLVVGAALLRLAKPLA